MSSQLFSSAYIFNPQNGISTRILRVCKREFRALFKRHNEDANYYMKLFFWKDNNVHKNITWTDNFVPDLICFEELYIMKLMLFMEWNWCGYSLYIYKGLKSMKLIPLFSNLKQNISYMMIDILTFNCSSLAMPTVLRKLFMWFLWSPCSCITSPYSGCSTTVPLHANSCNMNIELQFLPSCNQGLTNRFSYDLPSRDFSRLFLGPNFGPIPNGKSACIFPKSRWNFPIWSTPKLSVMFPL